MAFDEEAAGKLLAEAAKLDGCTVEQAFQRAVNLYKLVLTDVWGRGLMLGVFDTEDSTLLGFIDAREEVDPNFEVDL